MKQHVLLLWSCVLLVACAPFAIGCGEGLPERVPVSGVVTIDGAPLTTGQVIVAPANQRASIGAIGADGRFTLTCYEIGDGVVPGTHAVTVSAVEQIDEHTNRYHAPKKYDDQRTSGLSVTIDKPTTDLKIELSWDGGKQFVEKF